MLAARSKRHPSVLRSDEALLIVVDMQEPFLRNVLNRDRVIRNVAMLIRAARILRVPVIPTLQNARRMGGPIPEVAAALPSLTIPFDKMSFSCLGDEAFASEIQRSGRKQALLCGVETHICICQTALDLSAAGYQVEVAADSVSSRHEADYEVALARMEHAGVLISTAEMAIYEMLTEANSPEFRDILPLIKES